MIVDHITNFKGGWFIGNFPQSLLRTARFEVALKTHTKGSRWTPHYHAVGTEYNVIVTGIMTVQGQQLVAGDIFIMEPGELADPDFLLDTDIVTVKVPSLPGDKYEVNSTSR